LFRRALGPDAAAAASARRQQQQRLQRVSRAAGEQASVADANARLESGQLAEMVGEPSSALLHPQAAEAEAEAEGETPTSAVFAGEPLQISPASALSSKRTPRTTRNSSIALPSQHHHHHHHHHHHSVGQLAGHHPADAPSSLPNVPRLSELPR
ncbi:hypothetical protein EV177_010738, partial [Coemansia sp. RSA 1804]